MISTTYLITLTGILSHPTDLVLFRDNMAFFNVALLIALKENALVGRVK